MADIAFDILTDLLHYTYLLGRADSIRRPDGRRDLVDDRVSEITNYKNKK